MTTKQHLYNYDTSERLGLATQEQIDASDANASKGGVGPIMVDIRTGEVLTPGTFAAQEAAKSNATCIAYTY